MQPDKRLEWCRENISSFKDANDRAEKARAESEENRQRLGHLLPKKPPEFLLMDGPVDRPTLNQIRLAGSRGAA